ncbi:MAG: signal recognition particle-docking protein FtsY [Candidatus Puniceispirillaceae bacterium]
MSWFRKLTDGLKKSSSKMTSGLSGLFSAKKIDAGSLEELEEALIASDMGPRTAMALAKELSDIKFDGEPSEDMWRVSLAKLLQKRLLPLEAPLQINQENRPHVILLVGVNGSGKTTTCGKLARKFQEDGKSVMLAAADTFRAAASEQLQGWGLRTDTPVISGEAGGDAAALAYRAMEQAHKDKTDVLIIDTAGRLQNRTELMDELAKIHRVIGKFDETAPHDSIIVLDGTVGQNAIAQTKAFQQAADVTGMIITKLDGSAKGGVVIALGDEFGLPVHMVGVGESADDLEPFFAKDYAAALVGIERDALDDSIEASA